jgi:hypothetical protein
MRWIELPDFLRRGTHAQKEQGVVKLDAFHMELFIKNGKRKFWWSQLQIFIENQTIGKIEYKKDFEELFRSQTEPGKDP